MPLQVLPDTTRFTLATALRARGEIAVAAAIGAAPGTLRRARDGVRVRPTTASAITTYLEKNPVE
jgi:hypothetical protein